MKKKLIAVCLAALLAFGLLPAVALAAPDTAWYSAEGGTSESTPYTIDSADDLAGLAQLVNAGNDFSGKFIKIATGVTLDLSGYPNWTPIGTPTHPFRGTFDGNMASINALTIDDTYVFPAAGARCVGLFGDIGQGGTVKNVALGAPSIAVNHTSGGYSNTYSYVGCIAGVNVGTVLGCTVTNGVVDVSGVDAKVGGVVGTNSSDSGTSAGLGGVMQDCYASVDIDAASSYQMVQAGGVAGSSTRPGAQIKDCSSTGSVTATGPQPVGSYICTADVGGLVGYIDCTVIMGCTSSCEVTAEVGFNNVNAGGLIGTIGQSNVSDSHSTGDVSGQGGESPTVYGMILVGGFTGSFSNNAQITDCYSTGDAYAQVTSTGLKGYAFAGGFAGYVKPFGPNTAIGASFATGDAEAVAMDNGYTYSGGFAGYLRSVSVSECFASGDAQSTAALGGNARTGGFTARAVDTAVTYAYATGDAYADCVSAENAGGFAGTLYNTNSFTECYSAGLPSVGHSGATSVCGAFVGTGEGTYTLTSCYYDSTTADSLASVGSSLGTATGAAVGHSQDEMTADDALSADMADLNASGHWMKRANILSERYYPEIVLLRSQAASKASVTVSQTYAVTVVSGSGSGIYAAGAVINITADAAPSGKTFDKWTTSGGGSFGDANSATTTFTVPAEAVTVTAVYKSTGGSGSSGGSHPPITVVETPSGMTGGVTVTPVGDAFDRSVEVRLTEDAVTQEQVQTALAGSGITHGTALVYPVDISLYIRGTDTRVQPKAGTSVRITCPIPQELVAYKDKLAVVCIVNGELSVLQANIVKKGGVYYVEFEASHFSPYAFVVDETGTLQAGLTIPAQEVVNPPKTGDSASLVGTMTLVIALGVALLLRKKA